MRRSKGRLGRNSEGAVSACAMGGKAVYTGGQVYTPSGLANDTTHFGDQTCQAVLFVFMVSTHGKNKWVMSLPSQVPRNRNPSRAPLFNARAKR